MQQNFEQFVGKQRTVELKTVGNCVAKTVLVESAKQFSFEDLCRTQYSLKYFSYQCRPSSRLKNLKRFNISCNSLKNGTRIRKG